jgi:hypothetical protein
MYLQVLYSIEFCVCVSLCCACVDATLLYKVSSDEGIQISVFLPGQTDAKPLLLQTEYYRLAVIVDTACEDSIHFMAEVRYK